MTTHATQDCETYSEAGYVWNEEAQKWKPLPGAREKGLSMVGTSVYTEHPSTEVVTWSYRLPLHWIDQHGQLRVGGVIKRWRPGQPLSQDLFDYVAAGHPIESHNAMFERMVWMNVCVPKYGWPPLPFYSMRCSMATARVNTLPGALDPLAQVLGTSAKDAEGKRLIKKLSVPRDPTKKDPRRRVLRSEEPEEFERFDAYCDADVVAEEGASSHPMMQPMSNDELRFWHIDQEINWRGIGVDTKGVSDCTAVLEACLDQYGAEFRQITGFNPTQLKEALGWLAGRGVHLGSMDADTVEDALSWPHVTGDARRVLEIRQLTGSASVKKLYALGRSTSRDGRLRNTIIHHGARTGRPTGDLVQPLNLPKSGPDLAWCPATTCYRPFRQDAAHCPWCGHGADPAWRSEWAERPRVLPVHAPEAVDSALEVMGARSLDLVEYFFGDALLTISGCVRGLFVAGPGHDLIASDYSSIEAVVIAMLSGCEWRIDAFRRGEPIYLLSASKITGTPVQAYLDYKAETGSHHPDRQKIGKVAELANGFGGWIGSNKAFGSTEPDDVIKSQILAWRNASPEIVELWGGQSRQPPWKDGAPRDYFGYEGCFILAIQNPGVTFDCRGVRFEWRAYGGGVEGGKVVVTLLSGRELTYHQPRLTQSPRWPSQLAITYMTWNSNPKYGPMGWVPMETYGGRLTENIVQATAHDVLRYAIERLREAGYPTVLHIYDEIVVEVPEGLGSVEEVERIMATMPPWAAGWPITAGGGWRKKRYRKG